MNDEQTRLIVDAINNLTEKISDKIDGLVEAVNGNEISSEQREADTAFWLGKITKMFDERLPKLDHQAGDVVATINAVHNAPHPETTKVKSATETPKADVPAVEAPKAKPTTTAKVKVLDYEKDIKPRALELIKTKGIAALRDLLTARNLTNLNQTDKADYQAVLDEINAAIGE